jgi:hypothetical protein
MTKQKQLKKGPPCPKCGSPQVIPWIFGEPLPIAFEWENQGKAILGGCCFSDKSPEWHCKKCGNDWEQYQIG